MLQKYEQSSLVVEAEVVSMETVKCDDGLIYQKVKIELFQILKGRVVDKSNNYATVILRGGTLNGEQQQWNHSVELPIGQRFIGFLTSDTYSCFEEETYRFFGGVQGKYYYDYDSMGLRIICPGHSFSDPNKFYNRLYEVSNSMFEPQLDIDPRFKSMTCLGLMFDVSIPNPLEPLNLDVLVSIRTSNGSKLISKPIFSFNYNQLALGTNAGSNGLVSLENIGISNHYNYESIISDMAPNEVQVSVNATNLSASDLILITDVYQPLVKLKLSLPSLLDPGVVLQEQTILGMSRYFDLEANIEKYFDCVRVFGDLQSIFGSCTPSITDMFLVNTYPTDPAAGVDRLMHITGECFGSGESVNKKLQFTNARNGFVNGSPEFVTAIEADILQWNDNNISFYIPSYCEPSGSSSNIEFGYAGQGKVRVYPGQIGQENVFAETAEDLLIQYAWRNHYTDSPDPNPTQPDDVFTNHSLPIYLVDRMSRLSPGQGYYMYYDANFPDEYKPAFQRALDSWRCSDIGSGVNIQVVSEEALSNDDLALCSKIYMSDLPIGLLAEDVLISTTTTSVSGLYDSSSQFDVMAIMNKADITFNQNVNWHYTQDTNTDISLNTSADIESVALHELGHFQGLLHTNHDFDIMYWLSNSYNRELTPFAIIGAREIVTQSTSPEINAILSVSNGLILGPATMYSDCSFSSGTDSPSKISQSINLFPNPSNEKIYCEYLDSRNIPDDLVIFNVFGSEIMRLNIRNTKTTIDVSDLSPGIYVIVSSNNFGTVLL